MRLSSFLEPSTLNLSSSLSPEMKLNESTWPEYFNCTFRNLSTATPCDPPETSKYLIALSDANATRLLPVMVYLGVLMVIGVVGNCLVLYVHIRKFKPSTTRTYVISLAIFDLLSCFISIPGEIVDIRYSFTFESIPLCKAQRFCATFASLGSGFTLIAVAVDRYRRICHPMREQLRVGGAKKMVLGATFASFLFAWPSVIIYGIKQVETKHPNIFGMECSTDEAFRDTNYPVIYTGILFVVFIMTFGTMLILYIFIGKRIYEQSKFRKTSACQSLKRTRTFSDDRNVPSAPKVPKAPPFCPDRPSYDEGNYEYSSASVDPMKLSNSSLNRRPSTVKRFRSKRDTLSRKTTFMLFLITLVFVVSFLPHLILKAVQALHHGDPHSGGIAGLIFHNIAVRSFFLNSICNAFIYGFCSPRFRKESAALLRTVMCKDRAKSFDVFIVKP